MEPMEFGDEVPTKVEAYEALTEIHRKWRAELRRDTLPGSDEDSWENQKTQQIHKARLF